MHHIEPYYHHTEQLINLINRKVWQLCVYSFEIGHFCLQSHQCKSSTVQKMLQSESNEMKMISLWATIIIRHDSFAFAIKVVNESFVISFIFRRPEGNEKNEEQAHEQGTKKLRKNVLSIQCFFSKNVQFRFCVQERNVQS